MGLPEGCGLALRRNWARGSRNLITDVPGVKVGHATIRQGDVNTGVTAILPHGGDLFQEKVTAACSVINGFGKSVGLVQTQELGSCGEDFREGAVGSGTGMVCLGLKGGIGSASRVVPLDGTDYTVGAMVMSNFGRAGDLVIGGRRYDTRRPGTAPGKDLGSIIIVLATDMPLNERQLQRVAKRSMIALGRVGSFCGSGSGDIAIAFTTADRRPHAGEGKLLTARLLHEDSIDLVFEAAVEAVEEAIVSSLYHAETTTGIRGNTYLGLRDYLRQAAPPEG